MPHRPPILCVDAVQAVDDKEATTFRRIPAEATVDGRLWEPWLVEGLAQTAAVLNGKNQKAAGARAKKGMLVGIRGLKIHRRPRAGETVRFHVALIKRLGPLTLIDGSAAIDDEEIASGNFKFYVELL